MLHYKIQVTYQTQGDTEKVVERAKVFSHIHWQTNCMTWKRQHEEESKYLEEELTIYLKIENENSAEATNCN